MFCWEQLTAALLPVFSFYTTITMWLELFHFASANWFIFCKVLCVIYLVPMTALWDRRKDEETKNGAQKCYVIWPGSHIYKVSRLGLKSGFYNPRPSALPQNHSLSLEQTYGLWGRNSLQKGSSQVVPDILQRNWILLLAVSATSCEISGESFYLQEPQFQGITLGNLLCASWF